MEKDILKKAIEEALKEYQNSEAKTKAGRWARFLSRFIPYGLLTDIFIHKISKK